MALSLTPPADCRDSSACLSCEDERATGRWRGRWFQKGPLLSAASMTEMSHRGPPIPEHGGQVGVCHQLPPSQTGFFKRVRGNGGGGVGGACPEALRLMGGGGGEQEAWRAATECGW